MLSDTMNVLDRSSARRLESRVEPLDPFWHGSFVEGASLGEDRENSLAPLPFDAKIFFQESIFYLAQRLCLPLT